MPDRSIKRALPDGHTEFLIIGGGPAGSTAAALLAREGKSVTLLEKEHFPRYHIGESLLASIVPVLEFIGVYDKVATHGFVKKLGAYFVLKQGTPPGHLDFAVKGKHAYQVVRSEFDELLLRHAAEQGALVREGCRVTDAVLADDRITSVSYTSDDHSGTHTIRPDYVIDASGTSGFLATKVLKNRQFQEWFANVAVGGYYRGFTAYLREQPTAFLSEAISDGRGWMWTIPLHDGTMSVGAVVHRVMYARLKDRCATPEGIFRDCLDGCPIVTRMLRDATRIGDVQVWQDYSYCSRSFAGTNYRLAGDAAGFIDPLFSSGVHMATLGAISAVASLLSLERDGLSPARAARFHDAHVREAYTRFVFLVAGAYQQIRNQSTLVLSSPEGREASVGTAHGPGDFRAAFAAMEPVLNGSLDLMKDVLREESVQSAMDYLAGAALEVHGIDSGNRVSKLVAEESRSWVGHKGVLAPCDGLEVRLVRGALGLQPTAGAGIASPS